MRWPWWSSLVRRVKFRPSKRATMNTPGSTVGSRTASNARIRPLRSSIFISPPLNNEAARFVDPDVLEFVEPLAQSGKFHPARRPEDALRGHPLIRRSLFVPPQAILDSGLEVVAHDPEPGFPGGLNVDLPLRRGRIGVVHDERLERLDARSQETTFSMPGPQQVQAETDMGVEEPFPVERGLAKPLAARRRSRLPRSYPLPGDPPEGGDRSSPATQLPR